MASIQFNNGVIVPASWLQDVNDLVYGLGAPQNIVNFFQSISTPAGAEIVGYSSTYTYGPNTVGSAIQVAIEAARGTTVGEYGAVGDGVADDTAAINAAIASLGSVGGVVNFAPGTYKVTSTITIGNGIILKGVGYSDKPGTGAANRGASCMLRGFTGANPMLIVLGEACGLDLIDFDGDNQGMTSGVIYPDNVVILGSRCGIGAISARNSTHHNVRFGMTVGQTAIPYGVAAGANNTNLWSFERIHAYNGLAGVVFDDTNTNTTTNYPLGLPNINGAKAGLIDAYGNSTDGVVLANCQDNTFQQISAQANGTALAFTGALASGATSGTLTTNFNLPSGTYGVAFIETAGGIAECRYVTLTNGSTAAAWTIGLGAACSATIGLGAGIHFQTDGVNAGPRANRILGNDSEANIGFDILTDFATLPTSNPGLYNIVFGNRAATLNPRIVDNSSGGISFQWNANTGGYSWGQTTRIVNPAAGGLGDIEFYTDVGQRETGRIYSGQTGATGYLTFQTFGATLADRFSINADGDAAFTGLSGGVYFNKTVSDTTTPGTIIEGGAVGRIDLVNSGVGTSLCAAFYNANGQVGKISTNASTTTYATSSDYRLKGNVEMADGSSCLATVLTWPIRAFTWNVDGTHDIGVIAHELQAIKPVAVVGDKDGKDMQGVDYSKLIPELVAAVQYLASRVAALEKA